MKKDNLKILILVGIPAAGKSTWAKAFVRNNPDWARVCRDDFRQMLKTAPRCEPKVEDMITELVYASITQCLLKKMNVIVDATNLSVAGVNEFVEKFKYQADIDYRLFDISLKEAIERDSQREKPVGDEVIKKMFKYYKEFVDEFTFQPVNKIEQRPHIVPDFKSSLPDAVIFDIDGTLALMGRRGPFEWDKVHKDDLNEIVAEQIRFHQGKNREIIIVTGRDASCIEDTMEWFRLYDLEVDNIFMRTKDDFRKDTVIKREIYYNNIKDRWNVLCCYDDRLSVIDMWYQEGVFTFNVNQGQHSF